MIEKTSNNVFTNDQVDLIKRTICKSATNDELLMFMQYCKKTGLDPFSRQIWSIERKSYNTETRQYESTRTIQVSIDGFRLIAERTGKYIGQTPVMWCGDDGVWVDAWVSKSYPVAAKVGVYRSDFKDALYAVAKFDSYVSKNKEGKPTQMWAKMPDLMIAKCAEALALRKAFPMELSGIYTNDEMDQAEKPPLETGKELPKKVTKQVEIQTKQKIDLTTILDNITNSQSIEELQKALENATAFMRDHKAKCAEALALRKAFPMELSGIYTNDEMDQAEKPPLETEKELPKKVIKQVEIQTKQKIDPTTILDNITNSQSIEELQKALENATAFMRDHKMPEIKNDIIKRKNDRKLQIEALH